MTDRDRIVRGLAQALEPVDAIYAMWLEGADAVGGVDAYSDLDFCIDFDDAREEEAIAAVEDALASLGTVDYRYVVPRHDHPKMRQRIYHLAGTGEYLMLDICWQQHSRAPAESAFIAESRVEAAQVLFDKCGVVGTRVPDEKEMAARAEELLGEMDFRYAQHCRVMKYVHRGQYPEAQATYMRYVVEPLVVLLRILYTPEFVDYGLVHISNHVPPGEVARLEPFLKVSSMADIARLTGAAGMWQQGLRGRVIARLREMA